MNIETHWAVLPSGTFNYGGRQFEFAQRLGRLRVGAFYGSPPGSHIGLWRTNYHGLKGLNLRIGRRYVGPCLTVLVHWLPVR